MLVEALWVAFRVHDKLAPPIKHGLPVAPGEPVAHEGDGCVVPLIPAAVFAPFSFELAFQPNGWTFREIAGGFRRWSFRQGNILLLKIAKC